MPGFLALAKNINLLANANKNRKYIYTGLRGLNSEGCGLGKYALGGYALRGHGLGGYGFGGCGLEGLVIGGYR